MKSTAFWAGYYGFRSDASEAFIQGYLDEVQRLDQRGQGVACGKGWIPRSKKCSSDKAKLTSKEAKAKTVEKAKDRAKLKGEVKAAKGQKPYVKPKPEPKPKKARKPRQTVKLPDELAETGITGQEYKQIQKFEKDRDAYVTKRLELENRQRVRGGQNVMDDREKAGWQLTFKDQFERQHLKAAQEKDGFDWDSYERVSPPSDPMSRQQWKGKLELQEWEKQKAQRRKAG